MAPAAILEFWNIEFLMVGRVMSVELRHHTKFRRNRSNRGRDMWVSILCELAFKMPVHAPFLGVLEQIYPQMMSFIALTPKRTVFGRNHVIWAIKREYRSYIVHVEATAYTH